jgi:hypothetical protein
VIRPPDREDLGTFAWRVIRLLDECELEYAICGSIAAMEYGEPRLSIDVDLMLLAEPRHLTRFVRSVEEWGVYVTPLEVIAEQAPAGGKPFNIIDGSSGSKLDIYPVTKHGLAGSAMGPRRHRVWDLESGDVAWFLAPEDVILFKLEFYRIGGEVSQKHPADIAKILEVMAAQLEVAYIERWAARIGVLDLWRRLWQLHRSGLQSDPPAR